MKSDHQSPISKCRPGRSVCHKHCCVKRGFWLSRVLFQLPCWSLIRCQTDQGVLLFPTISQESLKPPIANNDTVWRAGSLVSLPKSVFMGVFLLSWNQITEEDKTECGKNTSSEETLKWRSWMPRHSYRMIACIIKEEDHVSFTSACATYTLVVTHWWLTWKRVTYDCYTYSKWGARPVFFSWITKSSQQVEKKVSLFNISQYNITIKASF